MIQIGFLSRGQPIKWLGDNSRVDSLSTTSIPTTEVYPVAPPSLVSPRRNVPKEKIKRQTQRLKERDGSPIYKQLRRQMAAAAAEIKGRKKPIRNLVQPQILIMHGYLTLDEILLTLVCRGSDQ